MTQLTETQPTAAAPSKLVKVLLILIAAVLIFIGPTYGTYAFMRVLNLSYAIATTTGIILLIIGIIMMWLLLKRKIIT